MTSYKLIKLGRASVASYGKGYGKCGLTCKPPTATAKPSKAAIAKAAKTMFIKVGNETVVVRSLKEASRVVWASSKFRNAVITK